MNRERMGMGRGGIVYVCVRGEVHLVFVLPAQDSSIVLSLVTHVPCPT